MKSNRGFALLSLILAVAVIAVITVIFFKTQEATKSTEANKGIQAIEKAKIAVDQSKMRNIEIAIMKFKAEQGRNPKSLEELVHAGYISPSHTNDRNGKQFGYKDGKVFENN